jgi:hypothetical protein
MTFVLTCALCAASPALPDVGALDSGGIQLLEQQLSLRSLDATPIPTLPALPLLPLHLPDDGSGDGEHRSDHSHQMGSMWILMGAMMVVMMVGMTVYVTRNGEAHFQHQAPAVPSPAQLAVPVTEVRGGGG